MVILIVLNYLVQAYDSDLDYGTGDFYYMIWVKLLNTDHTRYMVKTKIMESIFFGNRIQVQTVGSANGELAIYSGVNQIDFWCYSALGIGVWHHLAMVRRGSTMYWYKDGTICFI